MAVAILSTLKRTSIAGREDFVLGISPPHTHTLILHFFCWENLDQETILSFRAKSPQPPVEEEDEHFDDTVVCLDTCK